MQGIPLDTVAVSDAATYDGETLYPHVCSLFDHVPELKTWIDTVLYDSAADSADLKNKFEQDLHIQLKASLNPRRKKTITSNLPRGMQQITPYGNMTCNAGFEMDYQGMRYESERFIFRAPLDENQNSVCLDCEHKPRCCPLSKKGRTVTIPFDTLHHIDPKDPLMAKRFKAMMSRRPSVERIIKRLKCDLSDDRLKKRGNAAFQAYLDKTMIAFHILLRN
ncbi:MAG: transposase [Desulfobacterales bacterium]|nr:transposase [Desulfobacterales bacterium]